MDIETLQNIASTNEWLRLWPEMTLAVSALVLLLLDVLIPARLNQWVVRTGVIINVGLLGCLLADLWVHLAGDSSLYPVGTYFGGLIQIGGDAAWYRPFFVLANLMMFWIAGIYFRKQQLVRTEFYAVANIVTAAMMLLTLSNHFVTFFVALETITIGFYVLVAYSRRSNFSLEAGIKYLIIGGTSTAILMLGLALLYGIGGNLQLEGASGDPLLFSNAATFLEANADNIITKFAVLAILASLAFKIGLVPFQIWIPDVYQGAPTPTTSLLAVSSKAAGVAALLLLFKENGAFSPMGEFVVPILSIVTIASLIYGNITAVGYTNLKRMLGMSGVSHAGFLMIAALIYIRGDGVFWISGAILFYLFIYLLGSFVTFGIMSVISGDEDEDQDMYDYTGLYQTRPFQAGVLAIGVGSLAGIPPLSGFIAKLGLFMAAFQSEMYLLLGTAVVSVVISIYYYFKWIREAFHQDTALGDEELDNANSKKIFAAPKWVDATLLAALGLSIIWLGFFPSNLISSWSLF